MDTSFWFYVAFTAFVLAMLAIDLGIFHRKAHVVRAKEAGAWVAVWMTLALAFSLTLLVWKGAESALLFATGYLIEQSLSIDNIFVIVMIFSYFRIPGKYQHRVLFWGIIGALLMRGLFIGMGALLIKRFGWIIYVFGAFLIFTGVKMALRQDEGFDAEQNVVMRTARRFLRVTREYHGQQFFTIQDGRRYATPLFLVLLLIEFTDLVFAVDSIPAIFAVTTNPFLVYTSNVFAILGLRSMYLVDMVRIPIFVSLGVIAVTLTLSIIASLFYPPKLKSIIDETQGKTGSIFGSVPQPSDERPK